MSKKKKLVLYIGCVLFAVGGIAGCLQIKSGKETPAGPMFYSLTPEVTDYKEFSIADYYITNKVTGPDRYYIDENSDLWGYGYNRYGQLGNGRADDSFTEEPFKIASDVISVDGSCNGYFCIYLTEDGDLYGMGSNMLGLLGQEYDKQIYYMVEDYKKVTRPVLLMEDVAYARAGMQSIVALKKDGSVWWWGQYSCTYSTRPAPETDLYWVPEADENNPVKMLFNSPHKLLDNCVYATTGNWRGAAIDENGDLYMWGLNLMGECGAPVSGDDYIRRPQKVLEDVHMVWPETIQWNSTKEAAVNSPEYRAEYVFNTFVQLKDGTMLAAGKGLGEKEKTTAVTGDLEVEAVHKYSDSFVPVEIQKYTKGAIKKKLEELKLGMRMEDVEDFLRQNGITYSYALDYSQKTGEPCLDEHKIVVESGVYELEFNDENELIDIFVQ